MKASMGLLALLSACAVDTIGLAVFAGDSAIRDDGVDERTDERDMAIVEVGADEGPDARDAGIDAPDAMDRSVDPIDERPTCDDPNLRCVDNEERQCVDGVDTLVQRCALGCFGAARCAVLGPSNGIPSDVFSLADSDFTVSAGELLNFNTDNGRITRDGGEEVRPAGGGLQAGIHFSFIEAPDQPIAIGVFTVVNLVVNDEGRIRFVGRNAAALLASSSIRVDGFIDAGARGRLGGPGGGDGGERGRGGGAPGFEGSGGLTADRRQDRPGPDDYDAGGGGGGGGSTGGGNGGEEDGIFGQAGTAISHETGSPLVGGGGGGAGGDGDSGNDDPGGNGGGGGGALQISVNGPLEINGIIRTPGEGGAPNSAAGGGGGAGGLIVLEAVELSGSGGLYCNGGSGAQGADRQPGERGLDGLERTPVAGLDVGEGAGGAGDTPAGAVGARDGDEDNGSNSASGGGGAAGRVVLRVRRNNFVGELSPTLEGGSREALPRLE